MRYLLFRGRQQLLISGLGPLPLAKNRKFGISEYGAADLEEIGGSEDLVNDWRV